MTAMTLTPFHWTDFRPETLNRPRLRSHGLAVAIALALHGVVLAALMQGWVAEQKLPEPVKTLTTQLLILPPAPAPVAPSPEPVVEPVQAAAPVAEPEPISKPVDVPVPQPDTQRQARQVEQAALARKRVEEQKRDLEQRRNEQQKRAVEQQKLAEQQQAQDQQRLAEQQRHQAEQTRQAAERARQSQQAAATDNSQYQPLSKEAPDYPERALDKGIEGDCTVVYDVSPQGRVVNPQVQGACHPLFMRPSVAAAETFRYQPRIVDGKPVTVSGVKNTFHYRIK
ncbi:MULTISPECIES: energy transducer TonB [Pseudomonas]|uniref:energy transducer TonB n=1 Tax=Pseudomonas TaxID=286 RepID=UPI000C0872BA|nr:MULTISPECIES: energy transducer TonB [Pseudomonas]MBP0942443.1 energy transducer TonB [Pseudomonas alliivorans]MEE4789311.1 energy transducer TonB [Pseudomonas alliivorans]MEE4795413.1 energy transducer TonB [Pseudomonas alliivorans]MEE4800538.1 energy transducer TonB [Pseudomonas alliivorans]MEE4810562.1 energy transducer TonB [Pseudomonas alliivorans]